MARAIDCGELEKRISSLARLARSDAQKALLGRVLYIVENMPTLTQPNEPLTIEQLREMDGEPVWVDDEKTYAILQVWDDDNIDAIFSKPRGCIHAKYAIGMKIYRHPPEEEA